MLDDACAGQRCFYLSNWQGSTTTLVNQTGSTLNATYHYGPYGESANWNPADSAAGNPFRYTGRRLDPETGLYCYRARYYSPRLGRFLQTDPVGTKDDLNLYIYATSDPLNALDPTGQYAVVTVRGDSVKLNIPIHFKGPAATPANIARVVNSMQSGLSGTFGRFTVTTTVTQLSDSDLATAPEFNEITLIDGKTDSVLAQGHSYVRDGREGQITMADFNGELFDTDNPKTMTQGTKGEATGAHEGGHLGNLGDKKGVDIGNLMDDGQGTRVDEADIENIINHPRNQVINCDLDPEDSACGGP